MAGHETEEALSAKEQELHAAHAEPQEEEEDAPPTPPPPPFSDAS